VPYSSVFALYTTEETYSMGVANCRDGVSLTQSRKRQRLILDSESMNLPDLQTYVKVPNNQSITLSRFAIRAEAAPFGPPMTV
jgi:hypothetical protein